MTIAGVLSSAVNSTMSGQKLMLGVRGNHTLGGRLPSKSSNRLSSSSLNVNDASLYNPTYLSGTLLPTFQVCTYLLIRYLQSNLLIKYFM